MGVSTGFSRSSRAPAYGSVATPVAPLATVEEAIVEAGLDYEVSLKPLFTSEGVEVPMSRGVYREDTQQVIGVVGNRYHVLQNRAAAETLAAVVGKDKAVFESGGTLRDGAIAFLVLKLVEDIVLPGDDVIERRFLFYTTHDGSGMTRVMSLPFRLWCSNQLNAAIRVGKKTGDSLALRHTASIAERLKEAERLLTFERKFYDIFEETARAFLRTPFRDRQMKDFAEAMFPSRRPEGEAPPPQTVAAREKVIELFTEGQGQKGNPAALGTAWAAFNAVTEYADHFRRTRTAKSDRRGELRAESNWFGSGARLKQQAMDLLLPIVRKS